MKKIRYGVVGIKAKHYNIRQIEGDRGVIVMPDAKSLTQDESDLIRLGTYPAPLDAQAYDVLFNELKNKTINVSRFFRPF